MAVVLFSTLGVVVVAPSAVFGAVAPESVPTGFEDRPTSPAENLTIAAEPIADTSPAVELALDDWAEDQRLDPATATALRSALSDPKTRRDLRDGFREMQQRHPKYDPELLLMLYAADRPRVNVMVEYRSDTRPSAVRQQLKSVDRRSSIRYLFEDMNVVSLRDVKKERIQQLGALDNVERVHLVERYRIPDPQGVTAQLSDTATRDEAAIGVQSLWDAGYKGQGIRVAVLDTGIDGDHPDLDDIPETGEPKIVAEEVFISDTYTTDPTDDGYGHGTHVAGIIAGTGEASEGQYTGVAPRAKLLNAKVANENADVYEDDVIAAIEWSIDNGADVISISLKFQSDRLGESPLSQKVNSAVDRGVYVSIAVGNEGKPTWEYFR